MLHEIRHRPDMAYYSEDHLTSIAKRWECAKQNKLCFCCLGDSHLGQYCNCTTVCGINGCKEVHHQLLHRDKIDKAQTVLLSSQNKVIEPKKKEEYRLISSKEQVAANKASNEVESSDEVQKAQNETFITVIQSSENKSGSYMIAFRTIPVYLSNGNRKIKVKALLDDASTKL